MLEFLPECLLIEILLLLPITFVLQLKSVCKLWYNIIKSPHFISKHLDHSNDDRRNNRVIAQFVVTQAGELVPYIVRLDDESGKNNTSTTLDKVQKLLGSPPYNYNICGPCDGLYYVWCQWMRDRRLWNPALKQFKMLPPVVILKPSLPSNIKYFEEYGGFGFDHVSVDYKVVIITAYWDLAENPSYPRSALNYPPSVLIYSLRNDSWKYVRDLSKHYYICENSSHTFVNTSLYWLGSYDKNTVKYDVIIVVNLATEAIEEVGLPETRIKGSICYDRYSECLMIYRSSIALVALYKTEGSFDIWTLKKSSWSKELSVTLDCRVRNPLGYYDLRENMVLFGGRCELILYFIDLKVSRVVRVMYDDGFSRCTIVSSYKESLLPLNDQEFWVQWEKLRVNRQIVTH